MQPQERKKETESINKSDRPSVCQLMYEVWGQIEADCLTELPNAQLKEICLIIAEVYMLNPMHQIKIGGVMLSVEMVQDVYHMLTAEHVQSVLDAYERVTYIIKSKKAYLRTALYNSVFELESSVINRVAADDQQEGMK